MDIENLSRSSGDHTLLRSFFVSRLTRVEIVILLAIAVLFPACISSDDHPPIYPIKGKVLFKGTPIAGGTVVFELESSSDRAASKDDPASSPLRATGRIEPDGSFRLMAFSGTEGVPEGKYKVGISSIPPRTEANLFDSAPSAKKGNPDVLRGKYSDPKNSGLRAEVVKDQTNEPTFDLE
jgi:hypothetical protein